MILRNSPLHSVCVVGTNKNHGSFSSFLHVPHFVAFAFHWMSAFRLARLLGAPCTKDRRTDRRTACWIVDCSWPTNKRDTEKTCRNLIKNSFLSSRPCDLDLVVLCSSYNISKIEKWESWRSGMVTAPGNWIYNTNGKYWNKKVTSRMRRTLKSFQYPPLGSNGALGPHWEITRNVQNVDAERGWVPPSRFVTLYVVPAKHHCMEKDTDWENQRYSHRRAVST